VVTGSWLYQGTERPTGGGGDETGGVLEDLFASRWLLSLALGVVPRVKQPAIGRSRDPVDSSSGDRARLGRHQNHIFVISSFDLRKWAFRGLMLDHWVEVMSELGVPRISMDATAALNKIEISVLKLFPEV
jgi:hypothetical protein